MEEVIDLPFPGALVRRVARQSMTIYPQGKQPVQRGLSKKSVVLLSLATGIFLKELAPKVLKECTDRAVKRKYVVKTLFKEQRLLFAFPRLTSPEIFERFEDGNELSRRIGISNIERPIKFPIEFVAPNPVGHSILRDDPLNREKENVEEALRAIVLSHHAYRQRVPDFFQRDSKK